MDKVFRVMVVDDHAIVREGLKSLIDLEDDFRVVAEAESGMDCLRILEYQSVDIVLMDMKMPGIDGIEVTRLIKETWPRIKVILLTNYDEEEYVMEAIQGGADGYVLKDVNKGDLPKILRTVLDDQAFIDPGVTRKVFHRIKKISSGEPRPAGRPALSQRELQILTHVVEGLSNKSIADALFISTDTVKSHLKNIYQKLEVHNRSQAAKVAIQEQLVRLSR